MKKVLRFLGVLLLVIIAGIIILGLVAPKDITVERTLAINAPKEVVAAEMFSFNNFKNWNPWLAYDPNTKQEVTGEDGKQGAKYSWSSDEIGNGEMIMAEVTPEKVHYTMTFFNPWGNSDADGDWRLEDAENGQTKVVWTLNTHVGFPFNGIMMALGMSSNLEKDFEKGLQNLKQVAEKRAKEKPTYNVEMVQFPGNTYAVNRQTISTDEKTMMEFFSNSYTAIASSAGSRIIGPAACLAYKWDEANKQADLAPGFPVSGTEAVKGATMTTVNPSPAYKVVHKGGYQSLMAAHEALGKHFASIQKEPGLVIEEYIVGPGDEQDEKKWVTNIFYLVK